MNAVLKNKLAVQKIGNVRSENVRKTMAFVVGHSSETDQQAYSKLLLNPETDKMLYPIEACGSDWSKSTF